MELQNIRRLAVFKLRNIGDVLMITPALRALRETFPGARITVVVNSGTEAMLAGNPHLDEVLVYQRHHGASRGSLAARIGYEISFVRELRRRRFDLTIGFTEGDRAAWSALFSGARHRLGAVHYSASRFSPRRLIYNLPSPPHIPRMHEVEKHFYILEQAGLELREKKPGPLCLVIPEDLRAWAQKQLAPLRPNLVVHIHPVARWLWKSWRTEAMAEVIDWLQNERGARVVVTTGPEPRERGRAREIVSACRSQPLFFDGNLSLTQTAALSHAADLYFGIDTAPMHMAAAVGAPVVALFGPTDADVWGPWTPRREILAHACACNQTKTRACDWSQVRGCLAAITPAEAKAAIDRLLPARVAGASLPP
jgi:heptosyltransferase-3